MGTKRKLLSILLVVCLAVGLMPTVVFATDTEYALWVGGVEVTSDNASNITGIGITGTVSYDADTKTLTLNNATITGVHIGDYLSSDQGSAGIYAGNAFGSGLTINLIGENTVTGQSQSVTSCPSSCGIYSYRKLKFTGSGKLNVSSADSSLCSAAIYSNYDVEVGDQCTITATSGTASRSYAIDCGLLKLTNAKVSAGSSANDVVVDETNKNSFSPRDGGYKYIRIEKGDLIPVTEINVTGVTTPVIGQTPDFSTPSFSSMPENAVSIDTNTAYRWLKIAEDRYTGSTHDIWSVMASDEQFAAGYYYNYKIDFTAKAGYKIPTNVTGTINGSACTVITVDGQPVSLKKVFGPLSAGHTHNLTPVSAKPATCTATGNTAYYTCDGCDKWFADAEGNSEITDHNTVVIAALGHLTPGEWKHTEREHWEVCAREGCDLTTDDSYGFHSYGTEWQSDETNHWHGCICGKGIDTAAHSFKWVIDKEASATEKGSKHEECTVCGYKKAAVEIPVAVYVITSGSKQEIAVDNVATFVSDAPFVKFLKVQVDGADVAASNYTAEEGSTRITLKNDFIKGLSVGEHSITIVSEDGFAMTKFNVKNVEDDSDEDNNNSGENKSEQTGDSNNMFLWFATLFVSVFGVIGTTLYSKKKRVK
ncbi:MAG: hypothetical protein ACI4D4_06070 [Lachnospira sp.]